MEHVTDGINDPPLDLFYALTPSPSSTYRFWSDADGGELLVHVQLPPTYPLAQERWRMVTPIIHPLVMPHWDCGSLFSAFTATSSTEGDNAQAEAVRWTPNDAGRMTFIPPVEKATSSLSMAPVDETLRWFVASLESPSAYAQRFVNAHPVDVPASVLWWTRGDVKNKDGDQKSIAPVLTPSRRRCTACCWRGSGSGRTSPWR